MMLPASTTSLSVFAVILLAGYLLWTKVRAWSVARKAGYSSPVKYRHLDPIYGLDLFIKKIKHTNAENLLVVDEEIFAKYGKTVHTLFFGTNHWMTMDPLVIQTVAAIEVDKFGNEPTNRKPCGPLLGDGAFTLDGELWKRSRDLINPIFSRSQVSQLSSLGHHFERFLDHIPRDGSTIDVQPLTKMLFLDSSTEFIFGKSARSLSHSELPIGTRHFSDLFDDASKQMRKNYMTGRLSWLFGSDKSFARQCAEIHSIVDGFIEKEIEHQKQINELGLAFAATSEKLAYNYVLLKELVKRHADDKVLIRNELMNVFFGGRDSIGTVTANMLFLLARHPKVWQKLRNEVSGIAPQQELTFEFLKSLKYVQAVIEEKLGGLVFLIASSLREGGDRGKIQSGSTNAYTDMAFFLVRMVQEFKTIENRDDCLEYVEEYVMTKQSLHGVKVAFTLA